MDPETANAHLRRLEPLINDIVRGSLTQFPPEIIEEVEQAARVRLWSHAFPRFDPRRGALEPFARRVIERVVVDELRRLTSESNNPTNFPLLPDDIDPADPVDQFLADDEISIEALLTDQRLTKSERLLLRELCDQPDRGAIAVSLNIPVQRIYERLSRLKRKIKESFARCA